MRGDVSKLSMVFGAGLFAFLSQGVLYREFLWVFEGTEIATGLFLGVWLLWICAGASAVGLFKSAADILARRFHMAVFAYIPAMLLQQLLTLNARGFAGVASFESFSGGKLLLWTALSNAPVSFLTGAFFVAGCQLLRNDGVPVVKVDASECAGSCAGALASTIMLASGFGDFRCVLASSAALGLLCLAAGLKGGFRRWAFPGCVAALSVAALLMGFDKVADAVLDLRQWREIVSDGAFKGSFSTRQAKYLYGERGGQTVVVSWGAVCENIPGLEQAAEPAALSLTQNPGAKKVLVCGERSLSLCMKLAEFGDVAEIFWASFDPEYPARLKGSIPSALSTEASRKIKVSNLDLRKLLETEKGFDLAIINCGNLSSLVSTRYCTKEFLSIIKEALKGTGALAISFPGGDNYLSPELAQIGASFLATVSSVFPKTAFKPGDTSTLFASVKGSVSDDPEELSGRLRQIRGVAKSYAPENAFSAFQPERIRFQLDSYRRLSNADSLNSDSRPKSFIFSLMTDARRMGFDLPENSALLLGFALPLVLSMGLCHCLSRLAWRLGEEGGEDLSSVDLKTLIFVAAFSTMSLSVSLLFRHQTANGTLSVDFGALNACFMAASFAGALCAGAAAAKLRSSPALFPVCVLLLGCAVGALMKIPGPAWTPMLLAGFAGGAIVSAGAALIKRTGDGEARAGASVETLDCFGGALGGALASLAFIPADGLDSTAEISGGLLAMMSLPLTFPCVLKRLPFGGPALRKICKALAFAVWLALAAVALLFVMRAGAEDKGDSLKQNAPPPLKELPSFEATPSPNSAKDDAPPPSGKPLKIDAKRIEGLIKDGRLSDRKAMHWSPVED